ncbi:MAG: DUF58 domain-containing protein [Opitutales bacterium]
MPVQEPPPPSRGAETIEPGQPPAPGHPDDPDVSDWADARFFSRRMGRLRGFWKLFSSLFVPPKGHKTKPTPAGWILILLAMGIGTAAYNTSSNILFMTLSLLLSSLILSGVLSVLNFKGTRWRLHLPRHFREGQISTIQIELHNEKQFLPVYSIWFNVRAGGKGRGRRIYLEDRLDPRRQVRLDWQWTPARRGETDIEISGIESQYPFGFLRKTIGHTTKRTVLAWPGRIDYDLTVRAGKQLHLLGEINRKVGSGSDLINVKDYQPGDPPRLVHWKASARQRKLVVRQHADETRTGFILFLETAREVWRHEDSFERLCRLSASVAEDLFRAGRLIGVAINDEPVQPIKRLQDLYRFLDRLAVVEPVDHYRPVAEVNGPNIISFKPHGKKGVDIYVGASAAGSAQP